VGKQNLAPQGADRGQPPRAEARRLPVGALALLQSLPGNAVLLDADGVIVAVNDGWRRFARASGVTTLDGLAEGTGYLDACARAAAGGDTVAAQAVDGLQRVLAGAQDEFVLEYPCGTPAGLRWFVMHATRAAPPLTGALVMHLDISDRRAGEIADLAASEQRFRELAEAMPHVVWTADADGQVDYYNARVADFAPEIRDAEGRWRWDLVLHADDLAGTVEAWGEAAADGRMYEREHRIRMADGGYRWHLSRALPVRDAEGRIARWYGTATDVDHRRRAELALREAEERFRAAMDASSIAFAIMAPVRDAAGEILDFRWTYVNEANAALLGQDREHLVGARIGERMPGALALQGLMPLFQRVVERQERGQTVVDASPAGISGWFQVDAAPLGDGLCAWHTEVTGYRAAIAEANAAREQLEAVTRLMLAGVTRCTANLEVAWVSPRYAEWMGQPAGALVGRPLRELLGERAFGILLPYYRRVLAGERVEFEEEVDYPELGRRWVQASYEPSRNAAGAVDGWVAVVSDVTDRKRLELQLIEADRRKDEFLAVLAHELRNPLAPLRNGVQIARLTAPADATLRNTLDMMDRQLTHLVRLVDDLLDISRISRGKVVLRAAPLQLAQVLASSLESCRAYIDAHGQRLLMDADLAGVTVQGDFDRLAQVFSNLLVNAAKYSDRGGTITVSAEVATDAVTVRVADTGIGIATEDLERVFEMFSQVARHQGRAEGGLGIGLSLVRTLVQMHGGAIHAESPGPGLGSAFVVRLPLAGSAATVPVAIRAPEDTSQPALRILVTDDNTDAAHSLATLLRLQGHEVAVAHDGEEALEEADALLPDVVFMDLGMPRMDGLEAARRLRRRASGRRALIVALTGWGQPADRARSRDAGIDLHLVKPITLAALAEVFAAAERRR
jgi:PAS domain S-box-containing protein